MRGEQKRNFVLKVEKKIKSNSNIVFIEFISHITVSWQQFTGN